MRLAPVQVTPFDRPRARAADLPFDTRSITMVPYSPANAGIHPPGEGLVCEELQIFSPEVARGLAAQQLPEMIQKLWDPKSDKVREFATVTSTVIGLAPHPSPTVEVVGIVFGGVAAVEGYHSKALSLPEFAGESSNLVLQTLAIIAERTGHPTAGFLARVTAPAAKPLVLFIAHEFHKS